MVTKGTKIFKLQKPIFPASACVLGYDESREYQGQFPLTRELQKLFGKKGKIYVSGHVDVEGCLHIAGIAPEQNW